MGIAEGPKPSHAAQPVTDGGIHCLCGRWLPQIIGDQVMPMRTGDVTVRQLPYTRACTCGEIDESFAADVLKCIERYLTLHPGAVDIDYRDTVARDVEGLDGMQCACGRWLKAVTEDVVVPSRKGDVLLHNMPHVVCPDCDAAFQVTDLARIESYLDRHPEARDLDYPAVVSETGRHPPRGTYCTCGCFLPEGEGDCLLPTDEGTLLVHRMPHTLPCPTCPSGGIGVAYMEGVLVQVELYSARHPGVHEFDYAATVPPSMSGT